MKHNEGLRREERLEVHCYVETQRPGSLGDTTRDGPGTPEATFSSAINPCTMDAMLPGVYDLFGDLVLFQIGDWLKKHLRRRTKQKRPLNLLTYYYYFVI